MLTVPQFRPQAIPDTTHLPAHIRGTNKRFTDVASTLMPLRDTVATLSSASVFNVKDSAYGAIGNGTSDDTAGIAACVAACRAAGGGTVVFPYGKYRTTLPVNLANLGEVTVAVVGAGMSEYGIGTGTVIYGETGAEVFDCSGSQYYTITDLLIRSDVALGSAMATVGILQGRTATNTFSQFWTIENVGIYLDSSPTASARGTVGVYNCAAESGRYANLLIIADTPLVPCGTNVLGKTPTYGGALTGPASMTNIVATEVTGVAWTGPFMAAYDVHSFDCSQMLPIPNTGNTSPAFQFTTAASSIRITGQLDAGVLGWTHGFAFACNADDVTLDVTTVSPTGANLQIDAGCVLTGLFVRISQLFGSVQPLTTSGAGAEIRASCLYLKSGQTLTDVNLKVRGSVILSDNAPATPTLAAGSTYFLTDRSQSAFGGQVVLPLGGGTGVVSAGAANSGGAGFRQVLVPN